jgi:hypothetical protein
MYLVVIKRGDQQELKLPFSRPGQGKYDFWNADIKLVLYNNFSRDSSFSIVSDYGLDDLAIEVRSPAGAEDFSSSPCVQTLGPTQPPIQWVPGVLSPGEKRGRGVTLTTHPHLLAEVKYE